MKKYFKLHWNAFLLFHRKSGVTLAAACSFYIILSILPFLLLLIRFFGIFVGDPSEVSQVIIEISKQFFSSSIMGFELSLEGLFLKPLFAAVRFTGLNIIILVFSCLSFLTSVWNGLYLMSGEKYLYSWKKHFKGLVILGVTFFFVLLIWFIPSFLHSVIAFLRSNQIIINIYKSIPKSHVFLDFIFQIKLDDFSLLSSTLFSTLFFWGYVVFLYKWFFGKKINFSIALYGATTFIFFLLLGKGGYWIYVDKVRANMIENYGDFYTYLIVLFWIYLIMIFFFYAAAVCQVMRRSSKYKKESFSGV